MSGIRFRGDSFPGAGDFGRDGQGLLLYRMSEADAPGVETYSSIGIGARGSVLKISLDRTAEMAELTPYLVMTASQKLYLEEVIAVCAAKIFIV